ncbi:MAG: AraC family transcriptional regulator [Bradyrhizobium sp.]|nr:AraC family transcriptional regulator [Bradyrhizobium sp.]
MTDHLAAALLKSAEQNAIDLHLPSSDCVAGEPWNGHDLLRFLRTVRQQTQDDFCGLASHPCPVEASLFATEVAVRSETLGEALRLAFRLYAMLSPGVQFMLVEEGANVAIEIVPHDPGRDGSHFLVEWYAVSWYKLAQWLVGEEVPLESAEFPHARQAKPSEYAQVFGVTCRFRRPVGRIVFSRRFLSRRIVRSPDDIDRLRASADFDLAATGDMERSWRGMLKTSLRARLVQSRPLPTMEQFAQEFDMCGQTLRRRLRAEGSSYRQLKAEARHEVALDGISDNRITLSEVSLMAGFADTNGLTRAMKSWTGFSPSEYRRRAREMFGAMPAGA